MKLSWLFHGLTDEDVYNYWLDAKADQYSDMIGFRPTKEEDPND